ncbi:MAG: META domain-containing protein [Caldilineales bacterium]
MGENFVVGPIASTQKACEQAVMDQETACRPLQTAYGYSLAGSQLLIPTANGILTFAAPPPPEQPVPPTAVISGPELGDNSQPMAFDGSQSTPWHVRNRGLRLGHG